MPKRKEKPLSPEAAAALDRLAEKLKALPADRQAAFERDVLKLSNHEPGKRGRKPMYGMTLSENVLVAVSPPLREEMNHVVREEGYRSVPDYLRILHSRHWEENYQ